MLAEVVGTFILALMVLVNTEEQTAFSKQHWVTAIMIGLSLSAAVYPSANASGAIFNAQISLGLEFTGLVRGGHYDPYFKHFYVYIVFPLLGAFLAVLFFELVYKPTHFEAMRSTKISDMSDTDRLNA